MLRSCGVQIFRVIYSINVYKILFVCVEVLQPSQPISVMLSLISLPNRSLLWAGLVSMQLTSTCAYFFRQKETTALLESMDQREST